MKYYNVTYPEACERVSSCLRLSQADELRVFHVKLAVEEVSHVEIPFTDMEEGNLPIATWLYVALYSTGNRDAAIRGRVSVRQLFKYYGADWIGKHPDGMMRVPLTDCAMVVATPQLQLKRAASNAIVAKRKLHSSNCEVVIKQKQKVAVNNRPVVVVSSSSSSPGVMSPDESPVTETKSPPPPPPPQDASSFLSQRIDENLFDLAKQYKSNWDFYIQTHEQKLQGKSLDAIPPSTYQRTLDAATWFGRSAPQDYAFLHGDSHKHTFFVTQTEGFLDRKTGKMREARWYGSYKTTTDFLTAYEAMAPKKRCMYQLFRNTQCVAFFADIEHDNMPNYNAHAWNMVLERLEQHFYRILASLWDDDTKKFDEVCERIQSDDNPRFTFTEGHREKEQGLFKASNHACHNSVMFESMLALRLFMLCLFYNDDAVTLDPDFWYVKLNKNGVGSFACVMDNIYTPNRVFRITYSAKASSTHRIVDRLRVVNDGRDAALHGEIPAHATTEYETFLSSIVNTMFSASVRNADKQFLVPLITVDLVMRKCQRLGVTKVWRRPQLSTSSAALFQGAKRSAAGFMLKTHSDIVPKPHVELTVTDEWRRTWSEVVRKAGGIAGILRAGVQAPKASFPNVLAYAARPYPGKWHIHDIPLLLKACYLDSENKSDACYLNEMRTPVCAFMIDFDLKLTEGWVDLLEPQPTCNGRSVFELLTEFVAEFYPADAARAVLVMASNGKTQSPDLKEEFKSSYTIVWYKLVLRMDAQQKLLQLMRQSIARRFGSLVQNKVELQDVLDEGTVMLKGTRMVFQDKLKITRYCEPCKSLPIENCRVCVREPCHRVRVPYVFRDEKGVMLEHVSVDTFIECSVTRRAMDAAVVESTLGKASSLASLKTKVYGGAKTGLSYETQALFARLLSAACRNAPPGHIQVENGAFIQEDRELHSKAFTGVVRGVPCNVLRLQRPKQLHEQFHYHRSNGARYRITQNETTLFCMDPKCRADPRLIADKKLAGNIQHVALPEVLRDAVLKFYVNMI